jgi:hypothetical protein
MTEWVRSRERPLLDSRAFLDSRASLGEAGPNDLNENGLNEADGQVSAEVTSDALPAEE